MYEDDFPRPSAEKIRRGFCKNLSSKGKGGRKKVKELRSWKGRKDRE
jgi:hypothetical protein